MDRHAGPRVGQRVAFIIGPHKSGTSLLRALLDGHPETAVIPYETHLAHCFGIPSRYPLKPTRTKAARHMGVVHDRLEYIVNLYHNNSSPTSDVRLDRTVLLPGIPADERRAGASLQGEAVVRFLHWAFGAVSADDVGDRLMVEKSVENAYLVPRLSKALPSSRFVQIWRHPPANFAALKRVGEAKGLWTPIHAIRTAVSLRAAYTYMRRNRQLAATYDISYEALVRDPASEMRALARWLALPYAGILEIPTSQGQSWQGNSSLGRPLHGVDASRGAVSAEGLTHAERALLRAVGLLHTGRADQFSSHLPP
jgi:hypothetical protein